MKLSSVFPPEIKPTKKGVWKTSAAGEEEMVMYQYWNGQHWGYAEMKPLGAYQWRLNISQYQKVSWQGLAEEPK